ncbi:MAG: WecB/TagA/CpsF family glycosyltransferase [Candidatus Shapirobacteria bacterium]|jgi:N-acetylglucosaminyldiphosphoundecaprenol N-acetyl-beta-D-mannosaminyltransferase
MMKKEGKRDKSTGVVIDNSYLKIGDKFEMDYFGRGMFQLLKIIGSLKDDKSKKMWIVTVNPEFVMEMIKNPFFENIIKRADMRVIDGVGLLWGKEVSKEKGVMNKILKAVKVGGKILRGKGRGELISGADLIDKLSKLASKKRMKMFFLGAWGDRAQKSGENLKKKYSGLEFRACSGRPDFSDEETIKQINGFKTDILLVAYGMKKQEEWIEANLNKLNVKVVVGVGRSFDYYSGELKRAPKWVRKMGLEWLYSLIKEPKRWRRQLALPRFVGKVMTSNN